MSSGYLDQLDADALHLLAEVTDFGSRHDALRFFAECPQGIRMALGTPSAAQLLEDHPRLHGQRLLRIAVAVHRTAEEICSAGWSADDISPLDVPLLRFAGQGTNRALMVDLLASFLPVEAPAGIVLESAEHPEPGSAERTMGLIELCAGVGVTERAGALRLLGDEALFSSSIRPSVSASIPLSDELREMLPTVLPRAVRELLPDLDQRLQTVLDAHLVFGPIWYRMATQNLLHTGMRASLSDLARNYTLARRFLVRVAQGPFAQVHDMIFTATS